MMSTWDHPQKVSSTQLQTVLRRRRRSREKGCSFEPCSQKDPEAFRLKKRYRLDLEMKHSRHLEILSESNQRKSSKSCDCLPSQLEVVTDSIDSDKWNALRVVTRVTSNEDAEVSSSMEGECLIYLWKR